MARALNETFLVLMVHLIRNVYLNPLVIWVEGSDIQTSKIHSKPRIGVNYAGPVWSKVPYRFWFSNNGRCRLYTCPTKLYCQSFSLD